MSNRVKVKLTEHKRVIAGQDSILWTAKCLEDGHVTTGDTEAEAARHFATHMSKHPGKTIRKV